MQPNSQLPYKQPKYNNFQLVNVQNKTPLRFYPGVTEAFWKRELGKWSERGLQLSKGLNSRLD